MRVVTIEDLRRHVIGLWGKGRGIDWSDRPPMADHQEGTIRIRPIRREDDYATALHEIGHIKDRLDGMPDADDAAWEWVLASERRAWKWARANALIWTPTMERHARRSLEQYEAARSDEMEAYQYKRIREAVSDLCEGGDAVGVDDALIRNAVELVDMGAVDQKETRRVLIDLIDKYLATPVEPDPTVRKEPSRP